MSLNKSSRSTPADQMMASSPPSVATLNTISVEDERPTLPRCAPVVTAWSRLPVSSKAVRTVNPIREVVEPILAKQSIGAKTREDGKEFISLALGDPTANTNLVPFLAGVESIIATLKQAPYAASYISSCGALEARTAVAHKHRAADPDHVIIASGCSGALELALTSLLDPDSVLLVPQPGFPLYQVLAESHGARVVHYRLRANEGWECDLGHIQELVMHYGNSVRGIVVNNPCNPTGAVFNRQHLRNLICLCDQFQLPIVADEIYGDICFGTNYFHPLADVAVEMGGRVPIITTSGIGKQFLVPGWRVGWIVFQDNLYGSLKGVISGAKRLAQLTLGASCIPQIAVPILLADTPELRLWKKDLATTLEEQALSLVQGLSECCGILASPPGGAMYVLARIDPDCFNGIRNDIDFSEQLLQEENLFVLPGSCFGISNYVRFFVCAPIPELREATKRIRNFCHRHRVEG